MPVITLRLVFPNGYNMGSIVARIRAQGIFGVGWRPITGNQFEIFAQVNPPGIDVIVEMQATSIAKAFDNIAQWAIHNYPGTDAELSGDERFIF